MSRTLVLSVLVLCGAGAGLADFSYTETSQITGGMVKDMMKLAGAFSREAREPIQRTVMVKGNRMAAMSGRRGSITDLDKETITNIDFEKKTYSVITFAEMKQAMERAAQRVSGGDNPDKADVAVNLSVKETGQSKTISGLNAQQKILTFEMDATDAKTGQKGQWIMTDDMWLAPDIRGYDEVRRFHLRMAEKMGWAGGISNPGLAMMRPEMGKAMARMASETSKLNGVPVLQTIKMDGKGANMPQGGGSQTSATPPSQQPAESAQSAAAAAALGRLKGLGGLGGLGRRKKQQQEEAPASAPESTTTAAPGTAPSGSLVEMTTELTGFSADGVDASKLEVPAGFKQVESEMKRMAR